jgi:hypothetical protein
MDGFVTRSDTPAIVSALPVRVKRVAARARASLQSPAMYVHIVLWTLHPTADGHTWQANALEMKRRFEAMRGVIPGMARCDVGIDVSRSGESADVALYTEFESKAALEAYQSHPAHQDIVGFSRRVRSERRVVDFEA